MKAMRKGWTNGHCNTHNNVCGVMMMMKKKNSLQMDAEHDDAAAEEEEERGAMDWRFRPIQPDHEARVGGWKASSFILGAACCGYLGFGGLFFNLVLYLIRVWGVELADAANDLTNLLGTMFFTALVGGFVGDAYLGRLWTVVLFLIIYALGCILVGVAVTLQEHATAADAHAPLAGALKAFLFAALYVAAVGNGSYEPGLASLGGDQFRAPADRATFFNWFFVSCNIGQLAALTILTYVENSGRWALGFWIAAGVVAASIAVFFAGAPRCRQFRPGGNPLVRVAQVLFCAARNASVSPTLYYEADGGGDDASLRKLPRSPHFRWLDKAALIPATAGAGAGRPWSVCSVTQVEEVKCLIRIAPFFAAGVVFNAIIAQLTTVFIEQGATMDGRIGGGGFEMPPGSMQVFTALAALVFAPVYDYVLVPVLRRRTGRARGLTTLQRMGWGIALSIVAMAVAAIVEKKRLAAAAAAASGPALIDVPFATLPISMYWLVPQYAILGIALVLAIVGQMDFFYSEVSDGMRSVGISLPLVCRGLGNYVSTLLVAVVVRITTSGGRLGWIPANLNRAHIDYFYWLLAALMAATLAFYVVAARFYTYLHDDDECRKHKEVGLTNSPEQNPKP